MLFYQQNGILHSSSKNQLKQLVIIPVVYLTILIQIQLHGNNIITFNLYKENEIKNKNFQKELNVL